MTLDTMSIELRGIAMEATLEDTLEAMGIIPMRRPQQGRIFAG